MTSEPLLEIRGLKKYYPVSTGLLDNLFGDDRYIRAVDDVDLTLGRGETHGIIGESGSGKSTLVETLLRLEEPTEGEIRFRGTDVSDLSAADLRAFRENAQIIFQDPYETLNPRRTVFQSVAEPLRNFRSLSESELRERVVEMLHDVGLRPPEEFLDTYPDQLSGGQRQRVNIARAVVLEPDLLVADEPVSMLDVSLQAGIIKMMNRLQEEIGFSMLYVSHNLSVVRLVSNQVSVMYRGRFVERGPAATVIEEPKHPYTRALVQSLPDLEGNRSRVRLPDDDGDDDQLPSGCRFHPRCPDAMAECSERVPALAGDADQPVACFLHHDVDADSIDSADGSRGAAPAGSDAESAEQV
ncbi:MAG: ABC transporter ATP-binding protein [Haloferacaceae archaeon]